MSTNENASDDGKRRDKSPVAAAPASDAQAAPDFGSFMRQVFPEARTAEETVLGGMPTTRGQAASLMRRDYEAAFRLLQRASDAIPALLQQCQSLEGEVRRVRAESLATVQSANGETQQWQQIAVAMKMHIEESEHQIGLMRKRLAAAEERLAADHRLAQAAEQQASLAIGITTLFHDKIVDAFGVGSAAHAALDAAAQGALLGRDDGDGR